jgi:hypothetical protein
MNYRSKVLIALACVVSIAAPQGKTENKPTTILEKTASMNKLDGFVPLYWDSTAGKMWLEIGAWETEFLYLVSLPAGVGSNDIGLDRGQLGGERIVKFQRVGPRVLLVQPNYDYRAVTTNADERRSVEEAFAQSVLWGFDVGAEEGTRVLVDATSFYLRDAHDVVWALKRTNQGTYRLDLSRSAFYPPRTKNFPQNTEVEMTLTFVGDDPGGWVRQVVPTPQAITVREHQSFIQLPDNQYMPRTFDPRSGFFGISYADYATPISEPITKRFIARHRLQKKNPEASMSDPVKPLVYYLDRGAPEPIRSALLEGARWWNQAFEAAGYRNAFRVELLPDEADPMDVRYNVIQWVHRATRGWSYGGSVTDPRTGEMIKGHVTLGSLRVRQDFLIAEGFVASYESGKPISPEMERMALARLRQLAAHEVGHTLGLAHNYIASTQNRASVMDYPHPFVKILNDTTLDLSDAYATGIGEWDKVAIAYGYQDFAPGTNEPLALTEIITNARNKGLTFLTDQDARPQGSAHPQTHLWDNGTNAIDELNRVLRVRAIALKKFGERTIRPGVPLSTLEEALVPIYLGHRYQVEAASKVIGGLEYTYAMRGDGQIPTTPVDPKQQRAALEALLATTKPDVLALPSSVINAIPPRPLMYDRHRELFPSKTGLTFDPLTAAETAANIVFTMIFNSERSARLVQQHGRDSRQPSLEEILDRVVATTWKSPHAAGYNGDIQRVVDNVVLTQLFGLITNERALTQVRAVASLKLTELQEWMTKQARSTKDESQRAHLTFALSQIEQFKKSPKEFQLPRLADPPPGQPIGDEAFD